MAEIIDYTFGFKIPGNHPLFFFKLVVEQRSLHLKGIDKKSANSFQV